MKLYSLLSFVFLFIFSSCPSSKATDNITNVNLDSKIAYTIIVDKLWTFGQGGFVKIQDAVNSVPSGNKNWVRILVHPGIYKEKVTISKDKEFIILEGSGNSITIITYDDHEKTDTSSTFTSWPDNFVAKDITFKYLNNLSVFDLNGDLRKRCGLIRNFEGPDDPTNSYENFDEDIGFDIFDNSYNQATAVAARIYGDKSSFYRCGFVGFQDTLWDVEGRHYFKSCYIEGAIDFIWGGGQSFFENCLINVKAGMLPAHASAGYVTAQRRLSSKDPSGFVFRNCMINGSGRVYLGRAYGPYSRVIFWGTIINNLVVPAGWDAWSYQGHEGNFMYAEVGCEGPGADTSKRVGWERSNLKDEDLHEYSKERFIDQDLWISSQP